MLMWHKMSPAKKKRIGRPKKKPTERKTITPSIRFTAFDWRRIEQVAKKAGIRPTAWVRDVVLARLEESDG